MAEIIHNDNSSRSSRIPKVILDMTPMVDLAFLLLTFFVLAATLNKPKVVEIFYPDMTTIKTPIHHRHVMTVLLGHEKHQVYYYTGKFKQDSTSLIRTSCSVMEIGKVLMDANAGLISELANLRLDFENGKLNDELYQMQVKGFISTFESLMVLVKTCPDTPYESVIALMDQLNLAQVRRRSIHRMTSEELISLEKTIKNEHVDF